MDLSSITVEEIMDRLRAHLTSENAQSPLDPGTAIASWEYDPELQRERSFINAHFDTSRLPPSISKIRQLGKRIAQKAVFFWSSQQIPFNRAVVIVINKLTEQLLSVSKGLSMQDRKIAALETAVAQLKKDNEALENEFSALEKAVESQVIKKTGDTDKLWVAVNRIHEEGQRRSQAITRASEYHRFENAFRGDFQDIRDRQKEYIDFIPIDLGPVLDVGSGRGELLEVCKNAGLEAYGVDLNPSLIEECRKRELDVSQDDALQYLIDTERTYGAIIASHVLEHWDIGYIEVFLEWVNRRLNPGGVFLMETINPTSVQASCDNFWRDPTHRLKIHPDTARFLVSRFGFQSEIQFRSPVNDSVLLGSEFEDEVMARNFEKLNRLLFGFQDYLLIARKPR